MDISFYREQLAAKEDMLVRTSAYLLEAQHLLEKKNRQLSDTHKEIFDSIRLARLIQTSFLPNLDVLRVYMKDAAYLVRQQLGIGGDQVFTKSSGKGLFFGLLDATGHGIPAAMLSISCSLMIQEITSTLEPDNPAELTRLLNFQLYNTFNRSEFSLAHLEGCLFYFCTHSEKLHYISAKGKAIYIPADGEPVELEDSGNAIGQHLSGTFDEREFLFSSGDKLLIYSDGLIDQFGGPRDKKFTRKRLLELVNKNRSRNVKDLKNVILRACDDWRGEYPQTDDVSFILVER